MINGRWPLDDKRPILEIPSQSSHQVIIQHSPQPYEQSFGWPLYGLKIVSGKSLINKQTIFTLLTSWDQQHCHGKYSGFILETPLYIPNPNPQNTFYNSPDKLCWQLIMCSKYVQQ